MSVPARVRGLLLGAAAAELRFWALESGRVEPGPGTAGDDDHWMPAATRILWACCRSLLNRDGFDGPDQAHRFLEAVVGAPSGGFSVLERVVAGMLDDGCAPDEPGSVLANTLGGQSHDGIVRALPAALVAGSDDGGRRHLATRLVSMTHASDVAVASAGVVADAAAAWIRGEGGVRQAGHEPLRARSLRGDSGDWSACALDVVRSTIAVAGSTAGIAEAVEAVRSRWWGDARAAVLVGALAGARHGEEAIPLAWRHPIVDRQRLVRIADELHQRGRSGAASSLLVGMA